MTEFDEQSEDAGQLRKKLESFAKENKSLKSEVAKYRTTEILNEKGFTLVKPDDLQGVDLEQIEARAAELHEQRLSIKAEIAKDLFSKQGLEGEGLDEAVQEYLAGNVPTAVVEEQQAAADFAQARGYGRAEGQPVSRTDLADLHGREAIEAGLSKQGRSK